MLIFYLRSYGGFIKHMINIFQISLGFFLFSFCCFIYIIRQVPIYFSCLRERCNTVFAANLQKCFVDTETSPDIPSTWG